MPERKRNKLKVLQITFSVDVGGLEILFFNLIRRRNRELFDIGVCCLTGPGALSSDLEKDGVEVSYMHKRAGFDFGLIRRLAGFMREGGWDVVHSHDNSTLFYATVAAKMAGVKRLINTEHGGVYFESRCKRFLDRFLWQLNQKVVCVSQSIRADLIRMGLDPRKADVISNGIDASVFRPAQDKFLLRRELGLPDNAFIIFSAGRISPEKNHRLLVRAAEKLKPVMPEAYFAVAGDGALRKELEGMVSKAGLEGKFRFLGQRKDVARLLQASDCYVSTSNYESFGIAIAEAMLSGLPVVATDAGGTRELVRDRQTGLLVDKNDAEALSEAIRLIRNDSELSRKMAESASLNIKDNYTLERTVQAYQNLYLELS